MDDYFINRIVQWQPFFITVATVAGTLVGLLFISLSINRDIVAPTANPAQLRLARRSFADFIFIVLISLYFLIPLQNGHYLALELWIIGALKARLLFKQIRQASRGAEKPTWAGLVREYVFPILSVAGLVMAGIELYGEHMMGVYNYVVPVLATLLASGCSNAWQLLIMEKRS